MSAEKYTIGEVSKITGISKDTIRFYDKIGLIKPKYVDPDNKYRYYTFDQFWMLDIISSYRKIDVPLDDIRQILEANDNGKVVSLMKKHRTKAVGLVEQLQDVIEQTDWYEDEYRKIESSGSLSKTYIKYFPEKKVIYSEHHKNQDAFHIALMQACTAALGKNIPFRRHYGFLINTREMPENRFIKKGEYIEFAEEIMESIRTDSLLTFPAGSYLCSVVKVFDKRADFTALNNYLDEHNIVPEYVIADEIGLQLFDYTNYGYPCEIRIFLGEK